MTRAILAAAAAMFLAVTGAMAQDQGPQARMIVPDVPGGAEVGGCYRADRDLYGP